MPVLCVGSRGLVPKYFPWSFAPGPPSFFSLNGSPTKLQCGIRAWRYTLGVYFVYDCLSNLTLGTSILRLHFLSFLTYYSDECQTKRSSCYHITFMFTIFFAIVIKQLLQWDICGFVCYLKSLWKNPFIYVQSKGKLSSEIIPASLR